MGAKQTLKLPRAGTQRIMGKDKKTKKAKRSALQLSLVGTTRRQSPTEAKATARAEEVVKDNFALADKHKVYGYKSRLSYGKH